MDLTLGKPVLAARRITKYELIQNSEDAGNIGLCRAIAKVGRQSGFAPKIYGTARSYSKR